METWQREINKIYYYGKQTNKRTKNQSIKVTNYRSTIQVENRNGRTSIRGEIKKEL